MIGPDLAIRKQLIKLLGRGDLATECCFIAEHDIVRRFYHADTHSDIGCLRQIKKPILNLSANPVQIEELSGFANSIWGAGGFLILGWDVRACHPDLVYWPYFLLEQRLTPRRILLSRQHRISMLSGVLRPHRIQLWQQSLPYISHDDLVVINRFSAAMAQEDVPTNLPWSNHPDLIDPDQDRSTVNDTCSIDHPAYLACVNVTAETVADLDHIFITEKTWKSIAAGCMPWHGHPGRAAYLSDLGFSDHFNESQTAGPGIADLFRRDDIQDFYHCHRSGVAQSLDRFWSDDLIIHHTRAAIARLENWVQS